MIIGTGLSARLLNAPGILTAEGRMIGSQALVSLMAGDLLSGVEHFMSSSSPEVATGTVAIAILLVLSVGAALRADAAPVTSKSIAPATPAKSAVPSASFAKEAAPAVTGPVTIKKIAPKFSVRQPTRRPARAASAKRYRPTNVVLARPLSRSAVIRPASARGLLLFVERRSAAKSQKVKSA